MSRPKSGGFRPHRLDRLPYSVLADMRNSLGEALPEPPTRFPHRDFDDGSDAFRAWLSLGLAMAESGEAARARACLRKAAETDDAQVLFAVAVAYDRLLRDIGTAQPLYERAARLGSPQAPDGNLGLVDPLAGAAAARLAYGRCGEPRLLDEAVKAARRAIRSYGLDDLRYASSLSELCMSLRLLWQRGGSREALIEAVEAGRAAVGASSEGDPELGGHLSSLATALHEVFESTGDLAVIDETIALHRRCLEITPHHHRERAGYQSNLGNALLRRAQRRPDRAVLEEAVLCGRAAVRDTPTGDPNHPVRLVNLAAALLALATELPSLVAVDEAIETYRRALQELPSGHPARDGVRSTLAVAEELRRNLHRPPRLKGRPRPEPRPQRPADPAVPSALYKAFGHHMRYEALGHLPDLDDAISGFRAVLQGAVDEAVRFAATNHLGLSMWSLYERTGAPGALEEALGHFRTALGMIAEEDPDLPAVRANLASALVMRWRRFGNDEDLTTAIGLLRQVLASTPADDARRGGRLGGLGTTLLALAVRHQDSSALAEAVSILREAVTASGGTIPGNRYDDPAWVDPLDEPASIVGEAEAAPDASELAAAWSNLAEALRLQAALGDAGHSHALDEAADLAARAVIVVPEAHPLRARFLSNHSHVLLQRYSARGSSEDLANAAKHAQSAVAATPSSHPNRAERLRVLAEIRRLEHDRAPTAAARDELIKASEEAAEAVPTGHHMRSAARALYAYALDLKAVMDRDAAALVASEAVWREIAQDPTAAAGERVMAARRWAHCAMLQGRDLDWARAKQAYELAVELLPRTAPRRVTRGDRERQLARFAGLASDAAACAIQVGDLEGAVRLLEQGRGVLLTQALQSRTEVTDLHDRNPRLARRFEELRSALDRPEAPLFTSTESFTVTTELVGEDRHALAEEWEQLIGEIRRESGFKRFLQPPRVSDLLSATANKGPVVVVNVSGLRSDALLLTGRRVRLLPLPDMGYAEVVRRTDAFVTAVRDAGDASVPLGRQLAAQQTVLETLEWLWSALAEPVLDALGIGPRPSNGPVRLPWPRLWWIPTGALTALPLHAAGGVPDRVVSSYAPTITSLTIAQTRTARMGRNAVSTAAPLVVSMPVTPGAADLPGAERETTAVVRRAPDSTVLTGEQAQRERVLDALPKHPWAHFACHAVTGAGDLSESRLLLHDHQVKPLTIADITRLHLSGAVLAYLSACETSSVRRELADEAVHLTGAFLIAGYNHVIGTLWTTDDEAASRIAQNFYAALDSADLSAADAARALHRAVQAERKAYPRTPTLWATYLHVGA